MAPCLAGRVDFHHGVLGANTALFSAINGLLEKAGKLRIGFSSDQKKAIANSSGEAVGSKL